MSGRSPGRQRARPPSRRLQFGRRLAPEALAAGDQQPVQRAEEKRRLPQARRDDDGHAAAADEIGRLECDGRALARLSAAQDREARILGEQDVTLPGIESKAGHSLRPGNRVLILREIGRWRAAPQPGRRAHAGRRPAGAAMPCRRSFDDAQMGRLPRRGCQQRLHLLPQLSRARPRAPRSGTAPPASRRCRR